MEQQQLRRLTQVNAPESSLKRRAEENGLSEPKAATADEPVATYKRVGSALTLFPDDLRRLEEGVFLNDRLVDFVCAWAYDHCLREGRRNEVQLCDSYMYAQLTRNVVTANIIEVTGELRANFDRVKDYRRQKGPGSKDICLLAVCDAQHWMLAIILRQRTNEGAVVWIMVANSYPVSDRSHITNILKWYVDHVASGLQTTNILDHFKVNTQKNGYDCGLHTIHNAIRLFKHLSDHDIMSEEGFLDTLNAAPVPISRATVKGIVEAIQCKVDVGVLTVPEVIARDPPTPDVARDVGEILGGQILVINDNIIVDNTAIDTTWTISEQALLELLAVVDKGRADMGKKGLKSLKFKRTIDRAVLSCRLWANSGFARIVVLKS